MPGEAPPPAESISLQSAGLELSSAVAAAVIAIIYKKKKKNGDADANDESE